MDLVLLVHLVLRVQPVQLVLLVCLGLPDSQDLKDFQVHLDLKDCLVQQAVLAFKDLQDFLAHLVHSERLELRDHQVHLALLVLLEVLVVQDLREHKVFLAHLGYQVLLVWLALKAHKVPLVQVEALVVELLAVWLTLFLLLIHLTSLE